MRNFMQNLKNLRILTILMTNCAKYAKCVMSKFNIQGAGISTVVLPKRVCVLSRITPCCLRVALVMMLMLSGVNAWGADETYEVSLANITATQHTQT